MKKKFLLGLATATLVMGALTACGSNNQTTEADTYNKAYQQLMTADCLLEITCEDFQSTLNESSKDQMRFVRKGNKQAYFELEDGKFEFDEGTLKLDNFSYGSVENQDDIYYYSYYQTCSLWEKFMAEQRFGELDFISDFSLMKKSGNDYVISVTELNYTTSPNARYHSITASLTNNSFSKIVDKVYADKDQKTLRYIITYVPTFDTSKITDPFTTPIVQNFDSLKIDIKEEDKTKTIVELPVSWILDDESVVSAPSCKKLISSCYTYPEDSGVKMTYDESTSKIKIDWTEFDNKAKSGDTADFNASFQCLDCYKYFSYTHTVVK